MAPAWFTLLLLLALSANFPVKASNSEAKKDMQIVRETTRSSTIMIKPHKNQQQPASCLKHTLPVALSVFVTTNLLHYALYRLSINPFEMLEKHLQKSRSNATQRSEPSTLPHFEEQSSFTTARLVFIGIVCLCAGALCYWAWYYWSVHQEEEEEQGSQKKTDKNSKKKRQVEAFLNRMPSTSTEKTPKTDKVERRKEEHLTLGSSLSPASGCISSPLSAHAPHASRLQSTPSALNKADRTKRSKSKSGNAFQLPSVAASSTLEFHSAIERKHSKATSAVRTGASDKSSKLTSDIGSTISTNFGATVQVQPAAKSIEVQSEPNDTKSNKTTGDTPKLALSNRPSSIEPKSQVK